LHHKDLGIVQSTARELGLALPATALVSQLVASLVATGDGDLDHSALLALARRLNGVEA
jgi:2-hydroxy-3-oxopropionate reductase